MNHLNPLNIFLRQEIDRMQKVITVVRSTLKDLLLAVEGTIIMSEVRKLYACFINEQLHLWNTYKLFWKWNYR